MASYATFDQVLARAGRFAGAFTVAGKRPNQADVEGIVASVSAELDAAIRGRGYDPATIAQTVKDSLVDLAAFGALSRALPAVSSGRDVTDLADRARDIYAAGLSAVAKGTLPAIAQLEAGQGGTGGQSAGDFWSEEPAYGSVLSADAERAALEGTTLAPTFARGQSL